MGSTNERKNHIPKLRACLCLLFFFFFSPYSLLLCKSYWSATTSWKKALGKKWNTKCFKFQCEKRGVKLKYSLEKGLQFSNFQPIDRWRVFSTIYNQFSKQNYLSGPVFNNVIKLNYSLSMNHISTSKVDTRPWFICSRYTVKTINSPLFFLISH